ncbi:hypothetical protein BO78DRAFT_423979 [Aspergillus sclerotiicarbonarius CBS 121057]|uniref:Uncharacterized protein n=1 Tax=Aspergillus sclerotiicarbonarius (strain CBS 121057 / IBT 28362) TaxID=1448318 RepID=A0A319DTA8_ASPSB|nr:hypothetical protein BO78DRAFT_423979 [Aspergillus sclerotiicarbonarius CBS 121057]
MSPREARSTSGGPGCPSKYRLIKREQRFNMVGEADGTEEFAFFILGGAYGLCFQADEVARCVYAMKGYIITCRQMHPDNS